MKLVIERSKWLRGEGTEQSFLLRSSDGKMCCLGFFGLACGLEPERLEGTDAPSDIPLDNGGVSVRKVWTRNVPEADGLFHDESKYNHSATCNSLMGTNDDTELSEKDREGKLTDLFASIGVEVVFVD